MNKEIYQQHKNQANQDNQPEFMETLTIERNGGIRVTQLNEYNRQQRVASFHNSPQGVFRASTKRYNF